VIFLAATTIVLTLVVNGLTLPWMIRKLGLRADGRVERETRAAEIAIAQAAALALEREMRKLDRSDEEIEAGKLASEYHARAARPRGERRAARRARPRRVAAASASRARDRRRAARAHRDARRGPHQRRDDARDRVAHRPRRDARVERASRDARMTASHGRSRCSAARSTRSTSATSGLADDAQRAFRAPTCASCRPPIRRTGRRRALPAEHRLAMLALADRRPRGPVDRHARDRPGR
jgi:hypothetical protein